LGLGGIVLISLLDGTDIEKVEVLLPVFIFVGGLAVINEA